ncbi:MAG TPA: substrate-binding domain-containing protein [Candidatus Dormibacteraeota bacterium]
MDRGNVKRLMAAGSCLGVAGIVAACGGSSTSSPTSSSSGGGSKVPNVSLSSFDSSFSVMSQFKSLTASGKGLVGVILPDTTSSTRYVNFDQPYLQKAFTEAGYSSGQFKIDNAQGSDATQLADAQNDITEGASVLVFDPLNSTVGSQIQQLAAQHNVAVISYDRATFTGTNTYYVSFDNVKVGNLIGTGFNQCVSDWNVQNPQVFILDGGQDTDPNAVSFAQGYNQAVWGTSQTPLQAGLTNSKGYKLVGDQITPNWVNATGGTIFQQQYTAHPNINATIEANDGLANAVITVLKNAGAKAKTIPTTGQDATLQGMESVLQNWQCGSVYKPIYLEAQAAVAVATILRANQTPPKSLVNGTTSPPSGVTGSQQPATLLTPTWVTASNMNSTVIKDKFIDASALCSAVGASVCSAAGISQ